MTSTKRQKRLSKLKKERNMRRNNYSWRTEYKFEPLIDLVGKPTPPEVDGDFVINKPTTQK